MLARRGLLFWTLGVPIAERVFRDKEEATILSPGDLYRVASVFTGLSLLGKAVPQAASLLSAWILSARAGEKFFVGRGLADVQTKSAMAGTVVQFLAGGAMVLWPWWVERGLGALSRPATLPEATDESPGGEEE